MRAVVAAQLSAVDARHDEPRIAAVGAQRLKIVVRHPHVARRGGQNVLVETRVVGVLRIERPVSVSRKDMHPLEAREERIERIHLTAVGQQRPAVAVEEDRTVRAEADCFRGVDRRQIAPKPRQLFGREPLVVVSGADYTDVFLPLAGRILIDDVVHHDPMHVADVHRIVGRAERTAIKMFGTTVDTGSGGRRPVVVVVARNAVQQRRKTVLFEETFGRGNVEIVLIPIEIVRQIAQIERVDRSARRRLRLLVGDRRQRDAAVVIEIALFGGVGQM